MRHGNHFTRRYKAALRHGIVYRVPPDDGGDGGDGKGGSGGGGGSREKPVSEVVRSLVARHGDANVALGVLAGENRDYRARHRRDKETIDQLQGKLPKEGSVVLTPEQAQEWTAFQALGKAAEVKDKLDKATNLEAQVQDYQRAEVFRAASEAVGYNTTVLAERVKADGLHVEMRDAQVDDGKGGKVAKKLPHVRKADKADEQLVPLTEYADKNWAVWMPSLKVANGKPAGGGVTLPGHTTTATDGAGGQGATGVLSAAVSRRKAAADKPNPLAPKPATTAT